MDNAAARAIEADETQWAAHWNDIIRLRVACRTGDTATVVRLIQPSSGDGQGGLGTRNVRGIANVPLRLACSNGHLEIVRLLMTRRADGGAGLNVGDIGADSNNAIACARSGGHGDVVAYLESLLNEASVYFPSPTP